MNRRFKIIYHSGATKINTCLQHTPYTYEAMTETIEWFFKKSKLPPCEYRTFWIDEDLDEIEIVNSSDYFIFKTSSKSLHVSPAGIKPTTTVVHNRIKCDACQMEPIVGYRYKCIQCSDYDLCQKCESSHFHSDHMMVRMPTKNCPIDEYLVGSRMEYQCCSNATHFANVEILIAAAATATATKMATQQPQETIFKAAEIAAKVAHETALKVIKSSTKIMNVIASTSSSASAVGGEKGEEQINKKIDSEPQPYTIPIQILNNFNDMFTKILDLMENSESYNNQNTPNLRKSSTTSTKSSVLCKLTSLGSEVKGDDGKSMQKDQTPEKTKENKKPSGDSSSPVAVGDLGSDSEIQNVSESFVKIYSPIKENIATPSSSKALTAISSGQSTAPQSLDKSNVKDLVQLKTHIAQEAGKTSIQKDVTAAETVNNANDSVIITSSSTTAANTAAPNNPKEKRAVIVYHADQRINDAVNAMISMGFRNEEAYLTHLLESVNGNIPEALELMAAAQRNDSR